MFAVIVIFRIKPEQIPRFVEISTENARNSKLEPGCRAFDVIQLNGDPTSFRFYELYDDEAAFKAHQTTAHYLTWKAAVEETQAERRVGERGIVVS